MGAGRLRRKPEVAGVDVAGAELVPTLENGAVDGKGEPLERKLKCLNNDGLLDVLGFAAVPIGVGRGGVPAAAFTCRSTGTDPCPCALNTPPYPLCLSPGSARPRCTTNRLGFPTPTDPTPAPTPDRPPPCPISLCTSNRPWYADDSSSESCECE